MVAASFRYGVTITGVVLLVTGTLCFAWWSDGEVGTAVGSGAHLLPPREAQAVPSSSNALLRSVSFFCCGIGGILLLFGLLWSVKANASVVSRRYQYRFPRDLQYFTAEPPEKWNCRWVWVLLRAQLLEPSAPERMPLCVSINPCFRAHAGCSCTVLILQQHFSPAGHWVSVKSQRAEGCSDFLGNGVGQSHPQAQCGSCVTSCGSLASATHSSVCIGSVLHCF